MSDLYIGLMSGTSLDGIDGVLADFSGPRLRVTHHASAAFAPALRTELQGVACAVKFLGAVPHRLPVGAYCTDGARRMAAALQQSVHHPGIGPG